MILLIVQRLAGMGLLADRAVYVSVFAAVFPIARKLAAVRIDFDPPIILRVSLDAPAALS